MFNRIVAFLRLLLSVTLLVFVADAGAQRDGSGLRVPADFSLPAAMKMLYGNYNPKTHTSAATLDNAGATGPYTVRTFYLYEYNDSGSRYMLLATDAIPTNVNSFDCHACTPLLGAALLLKDGQAWKIEGARKPDIEFGSNGVPPDGDWFQAGPHRFGLKLILDAAGGGEEQTSVRLLLPWHGGFGDALWVATEDDNLDDCAPPPVPPESSETPCHSQKTSLSFVPGSNAEYYDLIERSIGTDLIETRDDNGVVGWNVVSATGTKRLRLIGGKYTNAP